MAQFGTVLSTPGLTWVGTRDPGTRELATQVDGKWLVGLRQKNPREWWLPIIDIVPTTAGTEVVKLPIDFEDLSEWQEMDGQRVARGVKPLQAAVIPMKPWYKDRTISSRDIKRNAFGQWPDRLAAMMLSSRRMMGVIVRDILFSTGSAGTSSKIYTYQAGGATQPLVYPSGHYCDPTEGANSQTFGNLHTGADQAASGNALFVPGATAFNTTGWELAQTEYLRRPGPGGVPLDMHINFVLGGSFMKPIFKRIFKRVLTLDETGTAAVTNIQADSMLEAGEEVTIPIVSAWLDAHPYRVANPTKQQWWTVSVTYPARPIGIIAENGGAPEVRVLDVGSEYEIENDRVLIKGTMSMNGGAAFPHVIDEWRET